MSSKIFDMRQLFSIGQRIRFVRKDKKLTQQVFCVTLGISPNFLSDLERDKSKPQEPVILLLELRYAINRRWLLTGEGPMHIDSNQVAEESVVYMAARSPTWKMCRQIEKIVTEGDKKKIEAIKRMLEAFDPGEIPLEGLGDGENGAVKPKSDCG